MEFRLFRTCGYLATTLLRVKQKKGSKIFSDVKRDINLICYVIEFSADEFSAKLGYANLLRSGLIKLSKDNLSLPIDDWLYSAINHSHPPIPERIDALKRYE